MVTLPKQNRWVGGASLVKFVHASPVLDGKTVSIRSVIVNPPLVDVLPHPVTVILSLSRF